MAESTDQNNHNSASESSDNFDEFCKNFTFSNSTMCYHCDGFSGTNSNQPVCKPCHTALFPSIAVRKRPLSLNDVGFETRPYKICRHFYDCDVGSRPSVEPSMPSTLRANSDRLLERMHQPSTSRASRAPLMLKDLNSFFAEINQINQNNNNNDNSGMSFSRAAATAGTGKRHINDLPVEILSKIFSDLDDKSLMAVGKVSKSWKNIVIQQQLMWKNITQKRWPLLDRRAETTNWFKMYTALKSSCCCRMCFRTMMQEAYNNRRTRLSRRGLSDVEKGSEADGIKIMKLNDKVTQLQATIVGPPGTPYEGGKFFLHIHMPKRYPYDQPTVKFLTKVIHPNVSRHGDIGLDVLTWNYSMAQSLTTILLSVQSLLGEPFTQECMEPELGRLYDNDRQRFNALARHWTKKYAMMDEITFDN